MVRNPSFAQNGDGLDLESCKNALIVNSTFDVGDDGICIKSGKDLDGRKRGIPCENVIVDECTVFKGHGGVVENIYIQDMSMFDIQTDVITFDLYYCGKSAVEVLNDGDQKKQQVVDMKKVDETTPAFRNIDINHVICRGARRAAYFNGLPGVC